MTTVHLYIHLSICMTTQSSPPFFLQGKELLTLTPWFLQKDLAKIEKLQHGPSGTRLRQRRARHADDAPPHLLPSTLDQKRPRADGKSSSLELRRASISLRQLGRHGQHQQLLQLLQATGSAARRTPERGQHATQIHGSASMDKAAARPQTSEETCNQRGKAPPQNSDLTAPPAPRRRQQETYSALHYVHIGIRGSPTLPPPKRPAEGEGTGGTPTARWEERKVSEIASFDYCSGEGISSKVLACMY